MQKTVVRNPNQSPIRRNLLNIAGIVVQGETITPPNGDRQLGGYGVAWLNNQDAASQTTGQDNPLPECNCESGGGGGGGDGGVQPSGNCEKKNISELKQVLDDYANQSFCDKEFPEVQFSTFIGYDKPPSDSTAKEIELRMLCPVDECFTNKAIIALWGSKKCCDGTELEPPILKYVSHCEGSSGMDFYRLNQEPSCALCKELDIKEINDSISKLNIQGFCGENTFYGYQISFRNGGSVDIVGMPEAETIYNLSSTGALSVELVYKKQNGNTVIDGCGYECGGSGGGIVTHTSSGFKFSRSSCGYVYEITDECNMTYPIKSYPFCGA